MTDPVALVAILVAAVVAFLVGLAARGVLANQSIKAANDKAARIVAEARAQQKELILQAKDEQVQAQRRMDEDGRARRADLETLERTNLGGTSVGRTVNLEVDVVAKYVEKLVGVHAR